MFPIKIEYFKEFVVLAETENYLEASETLYLSQSTLSRHIQTMEKDLGIALFDRTTRKVRLNKFGRALLPYARHIAELQEKYTAALANLEKENNRLLTIACIPSMSYYHITDVLAEFQRANPMTRIEVIEKDTSEILELLQNHRCDFAFIREHETSGDAFKKIPFASDHLVAVFRSDHPLAAQKSISLRHLRGEELLMLQKNTLMYSLCVEACRKEGFEPTIAFTGYHADNILDLVKKGMGVALLTKKPISSFEHKDIAIVDIVPHFTTTINLVFPADKRLSTVAHDFVTAVKDFAQENKNELF